jgi:hypothetical protein
MHGTYNTKIKIFVCLTTLSVATIMALNGRSTEKDELEKNEEVVVAYSDVQWDF